MPAFDPGGGLCLAGGVPGTRWPLALGTGGAPGLWAPGACPAWRSVPRLGCEESLTCCAKPPGLRGGAPAEEQ